MRIQTNHCSSGSMSIKAEVGKVKEEEEERRSEKGKSQKKQNQIVQKGRKVAKNCVFSCFVVPEGRQVGSLKRQVWNHVVS